MIGSDVIAISLPALSGGNGAAPTAKSSDSSPANSSLSSASVSFIAGPENRLVGAAAQWMLNGVERCYSPLVLHGPSGCGKTLLANAVAQVRGDVVTNQKVALAPKAAVTQKIVFTHGADFVREVATAIDQNTLTEFRSRYRSADLFVLDDLTDLAERRAAQRELINTLDALELREVPVVITSRIPPSEIADLPPALRSRLSGGLQVALAPPGLAARVEILNRLVAGREIQIEPAALQLLAEQLTGSVPELQGALHELASQCSPLAPPRGKHLAGLDHSEATASPQIPNNTLTVDDIRRYLNLRRSRSQPSIDKITKVVAKYYGLKPAKLDGPSRQRQVSLARSIAIYLGRQLTGQSLQALGKHFGNRDHSTVLYSVRTLESRLQTDADLQTTITNLRTLLSAA